MLDRDELLGNCLHYSINKLSRTMNKIAEEEFRITGLSPTYAFLLSIVNEEERINQKEISQILDVAPSTITRFIDKLEAKKYIERHVDGKYSFICSTEKGKALQKDIDRAWDNLHSIYEEKFGIENCKALTKSINEAYKKIK